MIHSAIAVEKMVTFRKIVLRIAHSVICQAMMRPTALRSPFVGIVVRMITVQEHVKKIGIIITNQQV